MLQHQIAKNCLQAALAVLEATRLRSDVSRALLARLSEDPCHASLLPPGGLKVVVLHSLPRWLCGLLPLVSETRFHNRRWRRAHPTP